MNPYFEYHGRIDSLEGQGVNLITSASNMKATFEGDSCSFSLRTTNTKYSYGYASIELDGEYMGRIKVPSDSSQVFAYSLQSNERNIHTIRIFNATEPSVSTILFEGFSCQNLIKPKYEEKIKIEFIGNSITSSMGVDTSDYNCGESQWFDQHNAYFSYARLVSEELNADYMLSSISGNGMYRNWDGIGQVLPQKYQNKYLDTVNKRKWNFSNFTPNIVSICLGTNDMSRGDGVHERAPFAVDSFVTAYSNFVTTIYSIYPDVSLALLTSPMLSGKDDSLLFSCLQQIKMNFPEKNISLFKYRSISPKGCDFHPNKEDQQEMAKQLKPFYDSIINTLK